jgi:hypothetical protein
MTESAADIPVWETDRAEICAQLERVRSPIKILLITRNESLFLERWIEHHARIVGLENLVIFDNMSVDPHVLSVYQRYRGRIQIARLKGHYATIFHARAQADLYRSLAKSSDYFLFIDTDEYLVAVENGNYVSDERVAAFVMRNSACDLFPTTWLWNVNWNATQFHCGTRPADLAKNLACGKPLIRASKHPSAYVNHNFQLGTRVFAPPFPSNLFLLHLARLDPRQRIATNLNKLVSDRFAKEGEDIESIAARVATMPPVAAGYVREIRESLAAIERGNAGDAPLDPGCMEFRPDGSLSYYSDVERDLITNFIADPAPAYDEFPEYYRLAGV